MHIGERVIKHIYNRGNNKRTVFKDKNDFYRFILSLQEFNTIEPIGSIWQRAATNQLVSTRALQQEDEKLVNIICYHLLSNHFHLLLEELVEDGISKFMHRFGGYTYYFNERHKQKGSGSLFQGRYKKVLVTSNRQLLHVHSYINLNDKVHGISKKDTWSSWGEYVGSEEGFCEKGIVLSQFDSLEEYKEFAEEAAQIAKKNKEFKRLILE